MFPLGASLWLFMCEFLLFQSIVKTLLLLIPPPTYLSHLLPMPSMCDACPVLLAGVCVVSQQVNSLPRYPLSTYIHGIHHRSFYHWSIPDGPYVPLLSSFLVVVQFSVCPTFGSVRQDFCPSTFIRDNRAKNSHFIMCAIFETLSLVSLRRSQYTSFSCTN